MSTLFIILLSAVSIVTCFLLYRAQKNETKRYLFNFEWHDKHENFFNGGKTVVEVYTYMSQQEMIQYGISRLSIRKAGKVLERLVRLGIMEKRTSGGDTTIIKYYPRFKR